MITAILSIIVVQTIWIIIRDIENILRRTGFEKQREFHEHECLILRNNYKIELKSAQFWEAKAKQLEAELFKYKMDRK